MNDHEKLIAELEKITFKEFWIGKETADTCGRAIVALREIQPTIDADTTLRNQFAGLAMQGLVARDNGKGSKFIAECSFDIASAMVAESKK